MPTSPILHQLAVALQRDDAHLEELFYRLNRAMVMDATAARAVHDLRNPLQAIVMAADTLNDKDIDAATVAQLGNIIGGSAEKLQAAMERLLTAKSGDGTAEAEPIILKEVVYSVLALCNVPAGITIDVDLSASLAPVMATDGFLRHAILNVMLNAFEALQSRNQGVVHVKGEVREGLTCVVIADDGPGISEDIAPQIFDPLFTTKDPDKHLGLGLFVASNLLKNFGGSLALGVTGLGARFDLCLPTA